MWIRIRNTGYMLRVAGSPEGAGEQVEHGRLLAQRDVRVGRGGRPVTHPPGDPQQVAPRHRLIQLTPLQPAFDSQGKTPSKSLLGTDSSSSLLFSPPSILKIRRNKKEKNTVLVSVPDP